MARPAIRITLIDRLGKRGCHRGHRVGESFDFDTERGKLCPMAMHVAFPYVDILRYGGAIPASRRARRCSAAPMWTPSMCFGSRCRTGRPTRVS